LGPRLSRADTRRASLSGVKVISTGRINQTLAKYGENAPMAATCCNACRTCVQTNLIGAGLAIVVAAGAAVTRLWRGNPAHD
jgi:hypothetical protein